MNTSSKPSVLIVMPTYDEIDSIATTLDRVRRAQPDAHVLVVDDSSPDGTGRFVAGAAARDPRLHLLSRREKNGLGAAYLAGFAGGLEHGFDVLVEMDADGSHDPQDVSRLLALLDTTDVVVGSRYVAGGRVRNWPRHRQLLSRAGNLYVRLALGTRLRDATSGFRAYRREVLEAIVDDTVQSTGYCFQIDLAWRSERAGFTVVEVPITFTERAFGASKMTSSIVGEALYRTTRWGLQRRSAPTAAHRAADREPARARTAA